jgi:hypothetical protein
MSTYYGSALAGSSNTTYAGNVPQTTQSFAHARVRRTLSTLDATPLTTDTIVVGLFKSSDRLLDIVFAIDGASTSGALNIGLHSADMSNNALTLTAVDADLFASATITGNAITYEARTSMFDEAGTLDDIMDRGKTLWELAAIGAASYTSDPGLTFAITATPSTNVDAATEMLFEVTYVAGD